MTHAVTISHNFETAHRLPHLQGKCENLHGHSWWATITVTAPATSSGVVIEFGDFKKAMRAWIDKHLDHGVMLGAQDPLTTTLSTSGKVFIFGQHTPSHATHPDGELAWPTVENVAELLGRVAEAGIFDIVRAPGTYVSEVGVRETHVNQATWMREKP